MIDLTKSSYYPRFEFTFNDGRTACFYQDSNGLYSGYVYDQSGKVESASTCMLTSSEAKQWIWEHDPANQ